MKLLVINCGSSSIKYKLYYMPQGELIASGLAERIGEEESKLTHKCDGEDYVIEQKITDHKEGLDLVVKALTSYGSNPVKDKNEIAAIGHRTVHGGERFGEPCIIDDEVINIIDEYCELAPLHNPPNLTGIKVAQKIFPNTKQVAVFDTGFHQTLPGHAYLYALPYDLYEEKKIRVYGFHGTSHKYVAQECARVLGRDFSSLNAVTCHLGNGASVAAIKGGRSIDTSMGFTPLEGLIMGTRCGDIDPAIVVYLVEKCSMTVGDVDKLLNKKSGLLGISGISNDIRELLEHEKKGSRRAALALEMYCYRVRKYIGAYMAALGRTDAVIFTAGVGENSAEIRRRILENLETLGIVLDADRNNHAGGAPGLITGDESPVKVMVVPTNEELAIAEETYRLVNGG